MELRDESRPLFIVLIATVLLVATGAAVVGADDTTQSFGDNSTVEKSDSHHHIENSLLENQSSETSSSKQQDTDTVRVVVEARSSQKKAAKQAVSNRGEIESSYDNLIQATLPRDSLEGLADEDSIAFIRSPYRATRQGTHTSEGVETVRANLTQERGWKGQNVTVVVIDHSFDPSHQPIADNVVHTNDTTGQGIESDDTTHGDATAEIVTDVAPEVNLVLVSARNGVQTLNAINYVNDNEWGENGEHLEVDAVSMSLGFNGGGPLDGTAVFDQAIDDSVAAGTPWFVSSGNAADTHWNDTFTDTNGNDLHEFSSDDECMSVESSFSVTLQWNDWPDSDQDYDLLLYEIVDGELQFVKQSANVQNGTQPPLERMTHSGDGNYCLAIGKYNADGTADFDMFFSSGGPLQYSTATRSVTIPATGNDVTAVGAVRYSDGALRPYSSRGPTIDGRIKPDIVGPDGVSNTAYEDDAGAPDSFFGTSAAAPHVAGVAAVVRSANGSANAYETVQRLTTTATSLGQTTPNNAIGSGLVDAAAAVPPQTPSNVSHPAQINASNEEAIAVNVSFAAPPKPGIVNISVTDDNGTTVSSETVLDTDQSTTTALINVSTLDDGNLTISGTTTDRYGWSNVNGETHLGTVNKDTNIEIIDYTDDEGVVRTQGLRTAITDWRGSTITTDLLRDVIGAWRSGTSVN